MPIGPATTRNIRLPAAAPIKAAPVKTAPAPVARSSGLKPRPSTNGSVLNEEQKRAMEGFGQFSTDQAKVAQLRERRMARPFNFFMKQSESRKIIVLDVAPYLFHWHEWPGPGGDWKNRRGETCLKGTGQPCPGCAKFGREGAWVMGLTIIDLTPFTPQKGKNAGVLQRFQRKFMPVKSSVIEKYERLYKKLDMNFRGAALTVHRSTKDKSPAAGDDFDFHKRLTEAELQRYGADTIKVVDYNKAFSPLSPELFAYVLHAGQRETAGGEDLAGVDTAEDDQIPFIRCDLRHEPMGVWRKWLPIL